MKPTKALACSAVTLCLAAGSAWACEGDSFQSGRGATSEPEEEVLLLEPVEAESLYGVDEDGDGEIDYLVLEIAPD